MIGFLCCEICYLVKILLGFMILLGLNIVFSVFIQVILVFEWVQVKQLCLVMFMLCLVEIELLYFLMVLNIYLLMVVYLVKNLFLLRFFGLRMFRCRLLLLMWLNYIILKFGQLVLMMVLMFLRKVGIWEIVIEMLFLYGVQWEMVLEMYLCSFYRFCNCCLFWFIILFSIQFCLMQCLKVVSVLLVIFLVVVLNFSRVQNGQLVLNVCGILLWVRILVRVLLEKNLKVVRLSLFWKVCSIGMIELKLGVLRIIVVRFFGVCFRCMVVLIMKFRVFLVLMNSWCMLQLVVFLIRFLFSLSRLFLLVMIFILVIQLWVMLQ